MKTLQFLLLFISALAFSQNDLKARMEYEDAETAFAAEDYNKAIMHLIEAEKLLGKWTPKVSYLLIESLDRGLDYEKPDSSQLKLINDQIKQYMAFSSKSTEIDVDKFRAINNIEKSIGWVNKQFDDPDIRLGMEYSQKKNYKKSFDYYTKSADRGNILAIILLSDQYLYGKGVEKNEKKTEELLKMSGVQNISSGMFLLGEIYNNQKKYDLAFPLYKKAAEKRNVDAMYALGYKYYLGEGVDQNYKASAEWFLKAAEDGNVAAMAMLGYAYSRGEGIEKNSTESLKWLTKAFEKGNAEAAVFLAHEYMKNGNGQLAIKCLEVAFENGEREAKNIAKKYIIELYELGIYGIEKNKKMANEWRSK